MTHKLTDFAPRLRFQSLARLAQLANVCVNGGELVNLCNVNFHFDIGSQTVNYATDKLDVANLAIVLWKLASWCNVRNAQKRYVNIFVFRVISITLALR